MAPVISNAARYQPGGDIYTTLADEYGVNAANRVATAARGTQADLNEAIADIRSGPARSGTNTLGNFVTQITTDPLAAPLASANNQIGKAVLNILKNPWVLLTVAVIVFSQLGGFAWVRKKWL